MIRRMVSFRMSDDELVERLGMRENEEFEGEVGIYRDIDPQDGTHCWVIATDVKVNMP